MTGRRLMLVLLAAAGCHDSSSPNTPGSIAITIGGLPAGTSASVQVTGAHSYSRTLTASTVLDGLAPGTYVIGASPVSVGSTVYAGSPATWTISLAPGASETLSISYLSFALDLQLVVQGLTNPVYLSAPTNDARLFIVEQPGRIRIVKGGQLLPTPFLDISSRVKYGGEQGLLSVAFDPVYATNGFFYVYFTDLNGAITIERYSAAPNADVASTTPTLVTSIPHPTNTNHNGGLAMFGPDGMLYIGTGDGGSAGDPPGNAQNLGSFLGKLLRFDVRTLPATPQIWAYGLRNPWRFDFHTGASGQTDLYIADVGQGNYEEIDVAFSNPSGVNYGWNRMEGNSCYPPGSSCNDAGLQRPVFVYDHSQGCSITGGFVYRGSVIAEVAGEYFFSDYCTGFLWSLHGDDAHVFTRTVWTVPSIGRVLSLGEDASGELYMLSDAGRVYRLVKRP